MSRDLTLRGPILLAFVVLNSVLIMPVGLWSAVRLDARSPEGGFWHVGLMVSSWIFFCAVLIANVTAARLTAEGLRIRVVNPFRLDVAVRWDQIDRIWLDPVHPLRLLMIRLKDPDDVAGRRRVLRGRMRRSRARYRADVLLTMEGLRPGTGALAEAIPRLSGGLHRLESLPFEGAIVPRRSRNPFRTAVAGTVIITMLFPGLTFAVWGAVEGRWSTAVAAGLLSLAAALFLRRVLGDRRRTPGPGSAAATDVRDD
ncbi:hypothetical protein J2S43_005087 [Catenuloplanes nepalensis]|uniref:PH domain-containing protein n=1 Tax=Catenuloplanes nepalensis TaxID=587533 RepID=A0ABT9MYY0_9ACTN|nr:hypothetical protein [Catenuloplanes nepalensis]MDP9796575.1 hypothetical protein [Catenuloplanes nepalensis]